MKCQRRHGLCNGGVGEIRVHPTFGANSTEQRWLLIFMTLGPEFPTELSELFQHGICGKVVEGGLKNGYDLLMGDPGFIITEERLVEADGALL